MEKQLYIIEYDNSRWCGGTLHCVAWATSTDDAEDEASNFMDSSQYELFSDSYEEEENEEECYYTVNSVELLIGSEYEQYYNDPQQRHAFYPCVN